SSNRQVSLPAENPPVGDAGRPVLTCVHTVGTLSPRARLCPGKMRVREGSSMAPREVTPVRPDRAGPCESADTPDRGGRRRGLGRRTLAGPAAGRERTADDDTRRRSSARPATAEGRQEPGAHNPAAGPQGPPGEDDE